MHPYYAFVLARQEELRRDAQRAARARRLRAARRWERKARAAERRARSAERRARLAAAAVR